MSESAFGVDHGSISKFDAGKKKHDASGSAIASAGAVTAGTGLLGGGIPGVHSNSETIANMRQGSAAQRIGAGLSSGRGGIFGYRTDAHQKALNRFRDDEKFHAGDKPNRAQSFLRGRTSGKIKPEIEVIRHLKRGRALSNGLLVAGLGATTYGVKRTKKTKVTKRDSDVERYHGALFGGGSMAAGGSIIANRVFTGQAKRWKAKEMKSKADAQKLVPNLLPDMNSNEAFDNGSKVFAGKSKKVAEEAGRLRGQASQQHYFSGVYGKTAKIARKIRNPAFATAAVGGGGLLLARKTDKHKLRTPSKLKRTNV